ncbi:MAG TPA: monovalent cation/H+ antiporter complex subunit F [Syntrophales bacterium]|nr:monovalent cation/H+ antiporter complex subunit F [Syntrophales bacterium]
MMNKFFLHYSIILTVIIFIPLYRVVKGPTIFDRMLGAGAIGTKTMVLILTIGVIFNRFDMFVDITLAYAVLNFIGIIAIAKFLGTAKSKE